MKRFILLFAFSAALPLCAAAQQPASGQQPAQAQAQPQSPAEAQAPSPPEGQAPSQAPAAPAPEAAAPSAVPAQSSSLEQPISLIPQTLPEKAPKPSYEETVLKESEQKLKKTIADFGIDTPKNRIRYREVKTKALLDDQVQAEWATAQGAKTDKEKRAALTRYYTLIFDRMLAIDPSLKEQVEPQRAKYLNRCVQHRVRPEGVSADPELDLQ